MTSSPPYKSDRYLSHDELSGVLRLAAQRYPELLRLHVIGKSPEGRELLVAELTDRRTGPGDEKPGLWVDGNIHAIEVAGSAASLHLLQTLLTDYGSEPLATELLSTRVLYVMPRLSPDGAEHVLERGVQLRSCPRPYPFEDEHRGLKPEDLDGDGEILQMRLEHPLGAWRQSDKDERLLLKRRPDDRGGRYYHLFREGLFEDWRGLGFEVPGVHGLDLNRNWPSGWQPEHTQHGAGRFPLSEPETRAVAEFLTARRNICGAVAYHTYGGVILRPFSTKGDEEMEPLDLEVYKALGQRGTELTGYPNVSVFHDFRYGLKELIYGGFDDWAYEHLGVFAFTVEIWNPFRAAGIEVEKQFIRLYQHRTEEEDLKLLAWNDRELGGRGFESWRPFEHPQLGRVELGGWRTLRTIYNPPEHLLAEECAKNTRFILAQAAATPLLAIARAEREELAEGLYKLTVEVENTGFLPTNVTEAAKKSGALREVEVRLELPEGAELLIGERRHKLGHLEGQASVAHGFWVEPAGFVGTTSRQRKRLEWLVRGAGPIRVEAHSERAGVCRTLL
jgi:murein tripeptide amidase MpaA